MGKLVWPADRAGRIARVVMWLLLAACLVNLWQAPDPAKAGIASRLAAGKRPMIKHYVATYNWYMAAGNAMLLAGLIASIPLWVRPTAAQEGEVALSARGTTRPDAFSWLLLAGAAGTLLFLTGPRLNHSLWGDEEYTFRRNIYGEHSRKSALDFAAPIELKRASWLDTVYGFKKPNNHIFQTILSRLSHEAWLSALPDSANCRVPIGEWALRLPSLLAALGTLPLLMALGAAIGQVRVGAMAAVLLAVHPWFQRYASEARGYAIVMFFTVALALLLLLGLREGRWRWWILYGLAQFLLLWCYVGAVFVPLALNLFALGWFVWRRSQSDWLRSTAPRWAVANLLSGMAFFQMMLPCLPMLSDYLREEPAVPEEMGHIWFQDLAGHLLGGMDGIAGWGDAPEYQSWEGLAGSHPALFALGAIGTAGITLLGLGRLLARMREGSLAPWLILVWTIAPLGIGIIHSQVTQHYYYVWYMIFALPGYAVLWAMGVELLAVALGKMARLPALVGTSLALATCLALILPTLLKRLQSQRQFSVEPLKESVALMRGPDACYPYTEGDTITAGFVMPSRAYDPAYFEVANAAELSAVADYARANGKSLYIAFGALGIAEARLPDIMAELSNPAKFQRVAELPGTWPLVSRQVYRMNPLSE